MAHPNPTAPRRADGTGVPASRCLRCGRPAVATLTREGHGRICVSCADAPAQRTHAIRWESDSSVRA